MSGTKWLNDKLGLFAVLGQSDFHLLPISPRSRASRRIRSCRMQDSLDKNFACFSPESERFEVPDRSGRSLLSTCNYKICHGCSPQFRSSFNQPLLVRSHPGFKTAFLAGLPTDFSQLSHSVLLDILYGYKPYSSIISFSASLRDRMAAHAIPSVTTA